MKRKPRLAPPTTTSEEDSALFRELIGPVRPLSHAIAELEPVRLPPEPRQFIADEARVMQELLDSPSLLDGVEVGEELLFVRPGIQQRVMRKLRRGQFAVMAEIDLHEMNLEAARATLVRFLRECREQDRLCVKVIHGKGLRSRANGPVLKRMTDQMLRQRDEVLAFASAQPQAGGTGATVVLLKRL